LDAGVRIRERPPPFIHAKALVVDDMFALIGTANLDMRSLRLNHETNLAVFDEPFVNTLKRLILDDEARSTELTAADWHGRPGYRRILENFSALMRPVL
jgi:cardiolipin synthase